MVDRNRPARRLKIPSRVNLDNPTLGALCAISIGLSVAGCSETTVTDVPAGRLRTTTLTLPPLLVPAHTAAMVGPASGRALDFGNGDIYVHRFRASTRNLATDEVDRQFVCHAHLGPVVQGPACCTKDLCPDLAVSKSFSAIQGTSGITLPEGFAVVYNSNQSLGITGMALNNNPRGEDQKVRYEIDIDYWEARDAKNLPIQPLEVLWVPLVPARSQPVDTLSMHWIVPPGTHVYNSDPETQKLFDILPDRARVHFIAIHLHAFGEWVELHDLTTGQTIWRGQAVTDSDLRYIRHIDHYSSTEGLILYHDHEYEIRTGYSNPLSESIDAMATMRMFYRAETEKTL